MSFVLLHFIVFIDQFDAHLLEHLFGLGTVVVAAFAHHAHDAAVDNEHGTSAAGCHTAVKGAAVQGDATAGCLADGILLGMNSAYSWSLAWKILSTI